MSDGGTFVMVDVRQSRWVPGGSEKNAAFGSACIELRSLNELPTAAIVDFQPFQAEPFTRLSGR
jgi:hypothetical protein